MSFKKILLTTLLLVTFLNISTHTSYAQQWAFEETFTGNPNSPSQQLLPQSFDYVVTHRRDSGGHLVDMVFDTFPADHAPNCDGPNPAFPIEQYQHDVITSHLTYGANPDDSFFICKDHMMSSMGQVSGYSVTSFYPKQEFDFSQGGILEWDVNINGGHSRNWYEVMISPRNQLKVGSAIDWLPIDETYPKDRIVFQYGLLGGQAKRSILIGTGALSPDGVIAEASEFSSWDNRYPEDPANNDRRIRRKNRIAINGNTLIWSIEKQDGSFDNMTMNIPNQGLPFNRGIVVFKTHAYNPNKDGIHRMHTFHWDNIRFTGTVVGKFDIFEATDVINLQANGNVPVGSTQTVEIDIDKLGNNPILTGQIESPSKNQVQLSINGQPNITIEPIDYEVGSCYATGWKSFHLPLNPTLLKSGTNTFKFTVGQRNCPEAWTASGYAVKSLQVEFDALQTNPSVTITTSPTYEIKPGDANNDGKVDGADYIIWLNNYSQNVTGSSNGDFNNDGKVDGADYIIWLNNYGT